MIFDGFISGMYPSHSRLVDLQECVNWYPEVVDANSKKRMVLRQTPGTTVFSTVETQDSIRGIFVTSTKRCFCISKNKLFEILDTGNNIYRGTVLTSDFPVKFADNGIQLIIVDGESGYIYDLVSNVFAKINSTGFLGGCNSVQFINGRFVVNKKDNNQYNLFWSELFDGTLWSGAVASAEGYADKLISIEKANNQLWLFGELSTEVFYDTGDYDQPYKRIEGAFFDNGTSAPYSTSSTGNSVFWLGSNAQGQGIVWMATGYQPQRISTHAIEYILSTMPRIDDGIGYCYQMEGHVFYVLTFPTANRTLCYDSTTGFWHERARYNNTSFSNERHIGSCCTAAFGKVLVGSRKKDGKIFELSNTCYTDDTGTIKRVRTSPHIFNENKRVFYRSFELDIEKGVGLIEGQGKNPNISLEYSNDGGYTWSNEIWRSAGFTGRYITRVMWNNLGQGRDRIYRVTYTDPVPCTLVNAYIEVDTV